MSADAKDNRSPAIIMRIREFGETDLLVTFFTPDRGLLKGVAKGGRKSRKRFVNCLDVCSLVSLEYAEKRGGDLCFLHSGRLLNAYPGLRKDFAALSKASYMIELTEILFPLGVKDREMFALLQDSLDLLAQGTAVDIIHLVFEARAMTLGGYGIDFTRCTRCRRPYTGRGAAVFQREAGGIACLKCAEPSERAPRLRPESVRQLVRMQSGPPLARAPLPPVSDDILREIKSVLKLHREFRLGLRPKSALYLE